MEPASMEKQRLRASLLKTLSCNARLSHLDSAPPIRTHAIEEGKIQIPLWSVPLVLVVLYVCLFSGLGVLGLVGPDEPRYAAIARAMAETHDWVTPHLWGAMTGLMFIAWVFFVEWKNIEANHVVIADVLAEVRRIRLDRGLEV